MTAHCGARRAVVAAVLAALLALVAAPGAATAAPVPCAGVQWATCDTRSTDSGYQYRYVGGMLVPVPLAGSGAARTGSCGATCPPDPAAVCDLLLGIGPNPDMSAEEAAQYDEAIAGCDTWLSGPNAVSVDALRAQFADYLRERLLPRPALTLAPAGRSYTGLPTIVWTPVPDAFAFNVDEPVLATISAVPTYHWAFGDGAVGSNAPGRPYDPALPPRQYPDAYVSHAYRQPGNYQITLTVTWNGSFTVPGVAQAFPLDAVTLTATVPVAVAEAAGVLTGNR